MGGYVQKTRAAAKPPMGTDAHGIDARSAASVDAATPDDYATQSPPRSLLQLRQALDGSPRVQQHAALQRALDQRAAAPAKKKSKEKPALQRKGIAINDDAGLEREADVMGARASATPALAADASAFAPARAGGWAAVIQRNGPDTKTPESKSAQDTKTAAPKPAPDTKVAAPKPQGAWGAGGRKSHRRNRAQRRRRNRAQRSRRRKRRGVKMKSGPTSVSTNQS